MSTHFVNNYSRPYSSAECKYVITYLIKFEVAVIARHRFNTLSDGVMLIILYFCIWLSYIALSMFHKLPILFICYYWDDIVLIDLNAAGLYINYNLIL